MRTDKLFSLNFDREQGAQKVHTVAKGRVNGILIDTDNASSQTEITVKVRGRDKVILACNALNMGAIGEISDLKHGYNYRYGTSHGMKLINEQILAMDATYVRHDMFKRTQLFQPLYLHLGHIDTSRQQIEILVNAKPSTVGNDYIDVYTYHGKTEPDHIIQYDITQQMDSVQNNVHELYFRSVSHFIDANGDLVDYSFQLDTDNGTYLSDSKAVLAQTNIFNRQEFPVTQLGQLYAEEEPIKGDVRVKVGGSVAAGDEIIVVRKVYTDEVSDSTKKNLQEMLARVENLERENAEQAKRLRHAGELVTSEELAEALEKIKDGEKKESSSD